MRPQKEVLNIFQSGIYEFVEISVKQQHERLLGKLDDVTRSGFTNPESCSLCNQFNLKPRHSEDECPSLNSCFCKYRWRSKRCCPNSICDYICEGIIEDHVKYTPNFKTTTISLWTKEYWEIAKCYMEHNTQSAIDTDILDLLHIIANNRFVFQKVLDAAKVLTEEQLQNQLDKVIKICVRIRHLAGSSKTDLKDLSLFLSNIDDQNALKAIERIEKIALKIDSYQNRNTCLDEERIKKVVFDHYKSNEDALSCKPKKNKGVNTDLDSLQLFAEQTLCVQEVVGNLEEDASPKINVIDLISERYNKIFVEDTDNRPQKSAQWSRKEWFIFNILNIYFNKFDKDENRQYSGIILVSESVSNVMQIPFKIFCEDFLKDFLKGRKGYLVIVDMAASGDAAINDIFKYNEAFQKHTIIKILGSVDFRDHKTKNKKSPSSPSTIFVKINEVEKLIIKNVRGDVTLQKETVGVIQQMLYKTVKKIGCKKISLAFENIIFDDFSTKINLSSVSEIPCLQMIECAFTPLNVKITGSIEIISKKTCILHYLEQMKLILYPAIQKFQTLPCIKSSVIKTGEKSFCLKINLVTMNTLAQKFLRIPLKNCSKEKFHELLEFEMANILSASECDINDYRLAGEKEKPLILNSIRFGILKSDLNYVRVYPAECDLEGHYPNDVVFVCFMKENYDVDRERVFGSFRGFKTFQRSYNTVSDESYIAESSVDACVLTENMKKCIEETVAFHSDELMEKHSNLEIISVSMGKAKNNRIDRTRGPCIVLYVRLVSFIPKGESRFPDNLKHPNKSTEFPIDVREGYFISLADRNLEYNYPFIKLRNLVMGCSFGMKGNTAAGTIGPFVQIESGDKTSTMTEVGFLTACHNFCLPENIENILKETLVVQPSDGDEPYADVSKNEQKVGYAEDKVCGEVVACAYNGKVDAALVRITKRHPQKGAFISCQHEDLKTAELTTELKYEDASISDPDDAYRKTVIKVGKRTCLTSGKCLTQCTCVKLFEDKLHIVDPVMRTGKTVIMKNMFHFSSSSEREICDHGDSGAGVFLVKENKELSCIGLAIGKTSDGFCVATPIKRILEELSETCHTKLKNLKVSMKKFG